MKKTILLLALLLITQGAFAYVEEYTTSDIKTLTGKGYSQSTLEVVDTARMLTQGYEKDYVPYYSRKFYSKYLPLKWYQMAQRYIDPAQDEHIFGVREIQYSNGWFDYSPSYNELLTPNDRFQRHYAKGIKRLDTAGKKIKGSNGVERESVEDSISDEFRYEDL